MKTGTPRKKKEAATAVSDHQSILPEGMSISQGQNGKGPALQLPATSSRNVFKNIGGSNNHQFNTSILREVISCLPLHDGDGELDRSIAAASAAMRGFNPADEIEGMIAAQAVALHFSAMECQRRAMLANQPFEIASKLRKDAANMSRAMTDMLEALDRRRGKGPQVIRVERMVVQDGAQAVVGNIHTGGSSHQNGAQPGGAEVPQPKVNIMRRDGVGEGS